MTGYPTPGFPTHGYPPQALPGANDPYTAAYGPAGLYGAPSGGTAITTIVLAFLGAAASLGGVFSAAVGALGVMDIRLTPAEWVLTVLEIVPMALLIVGATLMTRRQPAGRVAVAVGCGVAMVLTIASLVVTFIAPPQNGLTGEERTAELVGTAIGSAVALIPPIVTLVLALLPSTLRWLQAPKAVGVVSPAA